MMIERVRILLGLFLVCVGVPFFPLPAVASGLDGRSGSSSAIFLGIVPGARQAGLGESTVALDGSLDSFILNPAGLADMKGFQTAFSHASLLFGVSMEYLAFWYELPKKGTFGYFGRFIKPPGFEVTDSTGTFTGSTTSGYGFSLGLAYGGNITGKLSAGAAVSIFHENLSAASATGLSVDAGVQYRLIRGLRLGLMFANLGPEPDFSSVRYPLPLTCRLGIAWSLSPSDDRILKKANFTFAGIAGADRLLDVQSGAEIVLGFPGAPGLNACLRAGLKTIRAAAFLGDTSFGFGFYYKSVKFDYSISPEAQEFGSLHRISLVYVSAIRHTAATNG